MHTCLTSSVVKGREAMVDWELVSQLASRSSSGTVTVVFCESLMVAIGEANSEFSDEAGEDAYSSDDGETS